MPPVPLRLYFPTFWVIVMTCRIPRKCPSRPPSNVATEQLHNRTRERRKAKAGISDVKEILNVENSGTGLQSLLQSFRDVHTFPFPVSATGTVLQHHTRPLPERINVEAA